MLDSISTSIYTPTYLYIKQHSITGLKYFGKTSTEDPEKYYGSGIHWKRHIKKHGKEHVTTLWFQLFENKDELIDYALKFSEENNIVDSKEWANLVNENGLDGGVGNFGGRKHSEESKRKASEVQKGEKSVWFGRKHTDETKKKMSENHADFNGEKSAFFGKKHSEKSLEKMRKYQQNRPPMTENGKESIRNANRKRAKLIQKISPKTGEVLEVSTINVFETQMSTKGKSLLRSKIYSCCGGIRDSHGGFGWKWVKK